MKAKSNRLAVPFFCYAQPATVFAARFMGTPPMNIITLEVAGGTTIIADVKTPILPTPIDTLPPRHWCKKVVIIACKGISARVIDIEVLSVPTRSVACVVGSPRETARVAGTPALTPSESIHLVLPPEKLHFFDASNGRRRERGVSNCDTRHKN